MREVRLQIAGGPWKRAYAQRSAGDLPLRAGNEFVLPELRDYELIVLE
jgi:hypothetical protein